MGARLFELECKGGLKPVDKSITLAKYTEMWLTEIASGKLAKSTIAREKQDIARFLPHLGHIKLRDIQPDHFRKFYAELRKETIIVKEPKTAAGDRYVYFSAPMESLLKEYRKECAYETSAYEKRKLTEDDYVFRKHGELLPMSDYAFSLAGKMSAEQPYLVEYALHEHLDAKSVGIIWVNDDWGASAYQSTADGCAQFGIEITDDESFVTGDKDFTAILTKIRQTNPEYLVIVTQAAECALILNQVAAMNWDVPVVSCGATYSDQVPLLAGEAAEGLIASAGFFLTEEDPVAWDYATKFYDQAGFFICSSNQ